MKRPILLVLATFVQLSSLLAQTLDDTFIAPLPIRAGFINKLKVQSDGKILVGGDIAFYGEKRVNNLIRINSDGSLDETFNFVHDGEFVVMDIEVSASGTIVILVNNWFSFNSAFNAGGKIIKINPDGTLINETETASYAQFMAVQDDGKVLIGAYYLNDVIRYNDDLTEDVAFNNAVYFDGLVTSVNILSDKLLVGGNFSKANGVTKKNFVKLNLDGSIDDTFDAGQGTDGYVGEPSIQPDGRILLTEAYVDSFDGVPYKRFYRLNTDGSVDESFNPSINSYVSQAVFTNDGIYAAAFFTVNGDLVSQLFRMHYDGSIDSDFVPVNLDEFGALNVAIAFAGDHVIASQTQTTGSVFGISKIDTAGNYVDSFAPEISRYGTIRFGDIFHGKILIAGDFIRMNGFETYGIARLNLDGSLDESFGLKENKGVVAQMKVLNDNSVLVSSYKEFFKLDSAGQLKPEFNWSQFKSLYQVIKFEVLPDGKIMAADANGLVRLNADGSGDTSFDTGPVCCMGSTAFDFDLQGDKLIYGSAFSSIAGINANRIARLMPDGLVDTTFSTGSGADDIVSMIKVLDNNEVLVGGYFNYFDGVAVSRGLVKLSPDGKIDSVFNENQRLAPSSQSGSYNDAKVQQLGEQVYIRGYWAIAVVNTDGTVDENFHIPLTVNAISDIIALSNNNANGRTKTADNYLFALGSFSNSDSKSPSFLIKMAVKNKEVITGTEKPIKAPSDITVFPQPVNQTLKFRLREKTQEFHATIIDLSGKNYMESDFSNTGDVVEVDMQNAAPGFYMLKIVSKSGKTDYAKFLKVR